MIRPGAVYRLLNAKSGTVLDLSGADNFSVIGWPSHGGDNQKWHLDKCNGHFTLRNLRSGKYAGITENPRDGAPIVAVDFMYEWDVRPDEEDPTVFRLFVPGTRFNIDLSDHGDASPGTRVQVWSKWNGRNQCWRFEQLPTMILPGAVYKLPNAKSGTVIDLSGADNFSIIGWPSHHGDNQKWHVDKSNGRFTLRNLRSGKYAGITENPRDGAPVVAVDFVYEWDIRPDEEDPTVFRLFVPGTRFNIDLSGHGDASPGTRVQVWSKWNGRNQCWRFEQL